MSYQIQYDKAGIKIDHYAERREKKPLPWKLLSLILVLLCIYALNIKGVQDFFIPGNKEVTRSAFQELDRSLKEGQPFAEAFYEFCEEIVQNDDLA